MADGNEQVGELPSGWITIELKNIFTPDRPKTSPQEQPNLPYIGMEHIAPHTMKLLDTDVAANMKSNAVHFFQNDILYGRLRPYLNKIYRPDFEGLCSAEFIVFPEVSGVEQKYLQYLLNSAKFVSFASHLNEGDRPRVDFNAIGVYKLPLAPTQEQKRIVEKVEELFSDLDAGIESLKKARQQLKIYRQAVLKWAFEGKLTERWREEAKQQGIPLKTGAELLEEIEVEREKRYRQQVSEWEGAIAQWEQEGRSGKKPRKPKKLKESVAHAWIKLDKISATPDIWIWTKLGEVATVSGGLTKNSKRSLLEEKLPYLRVANVYANYLNLDDVHEIGISENEIERVLLKLNDLLIVEGNGSIEQIGRVSIWNGSIDPCVHQNHLIKARLDDSFNSKCALYFLLSPRGRELIEREAGSTSGLHTLSLSKVENLKVPVCSKEEQEQIVEEIESRLSICDQIETAIAENLQRAEALRQSILKRAFAGKLVPQDPNDEPAELLLERIRQEKATAQKPKKKATSETIQLHLDGLAAESEP
jgi:type I restriction enzyme, S subunit